MYTKQIHMTSTLNIFCAQANPTVGDTTGNTKLILDAYNKGVEQSADIVFLPEMMLSGYYPEDLLLRPHYIEELQQAVKEITQNTGETALVFGTPWLEEDNLHNSILFIQNGKIKQAFHKTELPNYGVFDEKRHFKATKSQNIIELNGITLGFPICEDLWYEKVCHNLKEQGAQLLLSANASPYEMDKLEKRFSIAKQRAKETNLPIIYLNLWGGQDELIFDGHSFTLNPNEEVMNLQNSWQNSSFMIHVTQNEQGQCQITNQEAVTRPSPSADLYQGLKTSLSDYMRKTGFKTCVIGMSGGIDSAMVAAIAADALGAENVTCIMMPSPYTSEESINDAVKCCELLGIKIKETNIEQGMQAFESMLKPALEEEPKGTTAENIQARIRGQILMAYSNQTGALVLTTGNKSEMAVGYATLYGDMCGAYNVLKDVYKTEVFKMANWRNTLSPAIPENIISKPPTAELRPDQKDEDSLPPYNVLDAILNHSIEQLMDAEEIIGQGYKKADVDHVLKLLRINEYKRRQSAPGPKVTSVAFERDWRIPIAGKYQY